MSDPKYVSRFPPCPIYDVEGMESWLEDLAKQGLILTKGGLFCGFAEFVKAEPKAMRYRLQPWPKKKRMIDDAGPYPEAIELAKEYGWEYLCDMGEFSVYGCEDPNARELDTDPQVQALSYQHMYRRKRREILSHILVFLLMVGLIVCLGPLTFLLNYPIWYTTIFALIWIVYPFSAFGEIKQLKALKQKLSLGEPLSRRKDWKRTQYLHWISAVFSIALALSFFGTVFLENFVEWEDSHWQPVSEYTDPLPFPTMECIAGGGQFTGRNWSATRHNYEVAVRSTPVAAQQMTFRQYGSVSDENGVLLDGTLLIDYYDLRTPWLARALYREILFTASLSSGKYDHYQELDTPDLPVEQATFYSTRFPYLLLQNGTEVLRVQLVQYNQDRAIPPEQWITAVAEVFLQ